jgi:hypothetical protein
VLRLNGCTREAVAVAVVSEFDVDVVDVGELHQQALGAAAAVLEVDLLEAFGGDVEELLFGGALFLGVEEAGRVLRGERLGEVAQAGVVGGAGSAAAIAA